jgi:hypothetical protein
MPWTRPKFWLVVGFLLFFTPFGPGVVAKTFRLLISPEQIASQMFQSSTAITTNVCGKGERDYDFICHIHTEPTAATHGKFVDQKVGITLNWVQSPYYFYVLGRPQFEAQSLPLYGPTPSQAENLVIRDARRAENKRREPEIRRKEDEARMR